MRGDRIDYRFLFRPFQGQFQPGEKIPKFLELMRWPGGISCPRCGSRRFSRFDKPKRQPEARYVYNCRACHRQFTVTTGTALHRTHVPLAKWLDAMALMKGSSRNLTAGQLVCHLGVTHKTAQKMCARLRRGMKEPLLRNLAMAIRQQKNWEGIYRNLFPDLYGG